jgi:hypothetical protein
MNHRCYQCGWSFTLGREAIEAAVAGAGSEKTYNMPCPRCRKINKIPIQQLKRTLPPGWTPPAPAPVSADLSAEDAPATAPVAEAEPTESEAEPEAEAAPAAKAATAKKSTSTKKATTTKKTTKKAATKLSKS